MKINLYPEMNGKISGLLRLSNQPAQMYAAELIDHLQKENKDLKRQLLEYENMSAEDIGEMIAGM